MPQVEHGESLYAVLRFALLYNGERFIKDIDDFEVSFPWNSSRRTILKFCNSFSALHIHLCALILRMFLFVGECYFWNALGFPEEGGWSNIVAENISLSKEQRFIEPIGDSHKRPLAVPTHTRANTCTQRGQEGCQSPCTR